MPILEIQRSAFSWSNQEKMMWSFHRRLGFWRSWIFQGAQRNFAKFPGISNGKVRNLKIPVIFSKKYILKPLPLLGFF